MEDFNYLHSTYEYGDESKARKPMDLSLVIVEDDLTLGKTLKRFFEKMYSSSVHYFHSANDFLQWLSNDENSLEKFCLITDISFEKGTDGLLLIDILKERQYKFVSLVITGFGSIETAITATKKGVFQYLTKPFQLENIKELVEQAVWEKFGVKLAGRNSSPKRSSIKALRDQKLLRIEAPTEEDIFCGMIGRSHLMKKVFERIQKVADCDSTVFINGPSGTGKELVANAIHQLSARSKAKLVSVNCGAIPGELLESELFGHVKGAFTGAISNRKGRFELANGGSIFLDEIGDMPLLLQVKLLRVLQQRQIELVGGSEIRDVDVRLITATHRNLEELVNDGIFREDLFYRLNVIPIKIPALKERREDIPLLISYFLNKFVSADGSNAIEFSDECLEVLLSYDWPGNVRELENLIERLVILRGGQTIEIKDLPNKIVHANPLASQSYQSLFQLPEDGVDLKSLLSDIEDSLILQALNKTDGNKNQASKLLSLNRTTLIEKMKKKKLSLSKEALN